MNRVHDLSLLLEYRPAPMPPVDWVSAQASLSAAIPDDYRKLVDEFGPGSIDDFLYVLHPTSPNRNLNLGAQVSQRLEALQSLSPEERAELPFPPYVVAGGLMPWGFTANGDVCYWQLAGLAPESWTVVVNESRGPEWDTFTGGVVDFLVALLRREHVVPFFPRDWPSAQPTFVPAPAG